MFINDGDKNRAPAINTKQLTIINEEIKELAIPILFFC